MKLPRRFGQSAGPRVEPCLDAASPNSHASSHALHSHRRLADRKAVPKVRRPGAGAAAGAPRGSSPRVLVMGQSGDSQLTALRFNSAYEGHITFVGYNNIWHSALTTSCLAPVADEGLSLKSLKEKQIKIGDKIVSHARSVAFKVAEGAIP